MGDSEKKPPEKNLPIEKLTVSEITVDDQYGEGFEAKLQQDGQATLVLVEHCGFEFQQTGKKEVSNSPATFLEGKVWPLDKSSKLFLKCPRRGAPATELAEFMKEFDNRAIINKVGERLIAESTPKKKQQSQDAEPSNEVDSKQLRFSIPRMYGKAELVLSPTDKRPCLVYEFAEGKRLRDWDFPEKPRETKKAKFAPPPATDVLKFAKALATAVQKLHNQGIVHSFLVPRNILTKQAKNLFAFEGTFHIVGFGYARLFDAAAKKAVSRAAVSKESEICPDDLFRAPETREPQTDSAYWFPADIYSIGALLYYLLMRAGSRTDPEALDLLRNIPTDTRQLKRSVYRNLTNAVKETVRQNENILKIIDTCLRKDPNQRYSCVEELLEAIEIALGADPNAVAMSICNDKVTTEAATKAVYNVHVGDDGGELEKSTPSNLPSYFMHLRETEVRNLIDTYGKLNRGHLEVYGSRDRIIASLCRLLGSAERHDIYNTVTLPDYWTDKNLGSMGRFLTMNKHMVRKGVNIRRVFLVTKDFQELSEEEQSVLEAQRDAWEDISNERKSKKNGSGKSLDPMPKGSYGEFEIMVLKVDDPNVIVDFESIGSTVAYLGKPLVRGKRKAEENVTQEANKHSTGQVSAEETVCLNFFSTATTRRDKGIVQVSRSIKKVRYWLPVKEPMATRFEDNKQKFITFAKDAVPITTYIGKSRAVLLNTKLAEIIDVPS